MGLQAQSPARMGQTIAQRRRGVALPGRSVHRLQKEMLEPEPLEALRLGPLLGIDQLELVSAEYHQWRPGLGADAEPVDAMRWSDRSVGLHRHIEPLGMERLDQ